ncbi:MAG TPA: hypothetical protein VHL53_20865 [Acidimicrobiia bacterium]|nr:hypothetical protein [Acidimicrobiia bacterium]
MDVDRRAIFFLGAAAICAALIPATEAALRWVPIWTAVIYVALAAASWLDWRSNNR